MRLHDDLTGQPTRRGRQVRHGISNLHQTRRLRPSADVEPVLTDYGLSPHPQLLLIVEGETELRLFPRVMNMFEVSLDPRFIRVESAAGVDRDLTALISHAGALRPQADPGGRFLRLDRPVTRVLVVTDPEGRMRTTTQRRDARVGWIARLMLSLPADQRTSAVRSVVEEQLVVRTWRKPDTSFEFAHFTDRQLARAVAQLKDPAGSTSIEEWTRRVERKRERDSLKGLVSSGEKTLLAELLWPTLEAKIASARQRGSPRKVPIVDVVSRAAELASKWPRNGAVIAIPAAE
jgi:hypothetical protein